MAVKDYPEYPVFKGLQRPLEFMGLQGRYILWAAITVAVSFLGAMIVNIFASFTVSLIFFTGVAAYGGVSVMLKQRHGLHSKKVEKGTFVVRRFFNRLEVVGFNN